MIYNYLTVCPSSIKSWFSRLALGFASKSTKEQSSRHTRKRLCWNQQEDDSLSGLRSSELDIEHTLAHRKRVWIGRHSIKANFNVSETHLD